MTVSKQGFRNCKKMSIPNALLRAWRFRNRRRRNGMSDNQGKFSMSRRKLLQTLSAAASSAYWTSFARSEPAPQEEAPALHNWMLVGSQAAFLSHLPMFDKLNATRTEYQTPHRVQVILEGSFSSAGKDVGSLYFADRRSHPDVKMFTVGPDMPFVLPRVTASSPLASFPATVVRGHLERQGKPVSGLQKVTVNIKKVIHFHKFDPAAQAPRTLEYFLFGRGSEFFLAHSIVKPPDFDQILSINVTGLKLTDTELSNTIRISIPTKKNSPTERLKEGEQAAAEMSDGRKVTVRAVREFYFEEGELRMPATFDDTPEEKKAGFPG